MFLIKTPTLHGSAHGIHPWIVVKYVDVMQHSSIISHFEITRRRMIFKQYKHAQSIPGTILRPTYGSGAIFDT